LTGEPKDSKLFLVHALECIERVRSYTPGGRQAFLDSTLIQDAVYRNFEVIGEAIKRIPSEVRSMEPAIQWRKIAGLRDVIIHQYEGIDAELVWSIVEHDLAPLERRLQTLLERLSEMT
jgi:uncharacterized protein with HEPN domain